MSLAERIREIRKAKELSLDDLASKAGISKTYLWELEKDLAGEKRPSADVLLRIASALTATIADLLELPTVSAPSGAVQIPPSLQEFQSRMQTQGTALSDDEVRDLAAVKFRGSQPQTVDEWHQLYFAFNSVSRKRPL